MRNFYYSEIDYLFTIAWIDISLVVNDAYIPLLYQLLGEEAFRNAACECLTEVHIFLFYVLLNNFTISIYSKLMYIIVDRQQRYETIRKAQFDPISKFDGCFGEIGFGMENRMLIFLYYTYCYYSNDWELFLGLC